MKTTKISPPGFMQWLASGDRGASSNTLAQHLTGWSCMQGLGRGHPRDPSDFGRCLELLKQVPALKPMLPQMADVSPEWDALVARWDDIEKSFLAEVGWEWQKGHRAAATYQLMKDVYKGAATNVG